MARACRDSIRSSPARDRASSSPDGYAVTNYHVVDHAKSVQVTAMTDDLHGEGRRSTRRRSGADQGDAGRLQYVKFATAARIVIGRGLGNPSVSAAPSRRIVSRAARIGAGPYDDYVQIDRPINKAIRRPGL